MLWLWPQSAPFCSISFIIFCKTLHNLLGSFGSSKVQVLPSVDAALRARPVPSPPAPGFARGRFRTPGTGRIFRLENPWSSAHVQRRVGSPGSSGAMPPSLPRCWQTITLRTRSRPSTDCRLRSPHRSSNRCPSGVRLKFSGSRLGSTRQELIARPPPALAASYLGTMSADRRADIFRSAFRLWHARLGGGWVQTHPAGNHKGISIIYVFVVLSRLARQRKSRNLNGL